MTPAARFVENVLARIAVIAAAIAAALWLSGCATVAAPYWVKTHEPVTVTAVRDVALPCGKRGIDGCFNRSTGVIELRAGMNALRRACVLTHEERHSEGDSHPAHDGRPHYSMDCGDGTTYVARGK